MGLSPRKDAALFSRRQISYKFVRRSTSGLSVIAMLLILVLAGVGAYFLMRDLSGPSVTMNPELSGRIGLVQNVELNLADKSGVQSVTVTVKRGDQSMTVLQQTFGTLGKTQKASFNLKETRLPEGAFELEIRAVDGSYAGFGRGNTTTLNLLFFVLDSQPPRIAVRTGRARHVSAAAAVSSSIPFPKKSRRAASGWAISSSPATSRTTAPTPVCSPSPLR